MFWAKEATFFEKVTFIILAAFLAFPVIDYILRNVLVVPILAALWHNLLLAGALFLVGMRLLFSDLKRSTPLSKVILAAVLVGIAYITLDLTSLSINIEGFRAMFQYMFVFFVAFYLNDRPEHTKRLMSLAAIIGTVIALYGIYQFVFKVPMPGHWVDVTETSVKTRAWSIVGSPNSLGSLMAMMTPVSLGLALQEANWTKRLLWLASAGLLALCLVATFSRGAWMALAGAIVVLGILYDRRILFIGIAAAILATVFVPAVSHRVTYLFTPEYMMKSAQSGRISRWFEAYDQMRSNPLFGVGLGHFGGAVAKRNYNTIYVDNYYMKTLAELGLLGLSAFLWLVARTIREGYTAMKRLTSPPLKLLALGMFGGLLAIIIHNAVENIFEIPYLNTYFWLVTGLLLGLPLIAEQGGDVNDR